MKRFSLTFVIAVACSGTTAARAFETDARPSSMQDAAGVWRISDM